MPRLSTFGVRLEVVFVVISYLCWSSLMSWFSFLGSRFSFLGSRFWVQGFGNSGIRDFGKSGFRELGNSGTWELGNSGIWEFGNLETWELGIQGGRPSSFYIVLLFIFLSGSSYRPYSFIFLSSAKSLSCRVLPTHFASNSCC